MMAKPIRALEWHYPMIQFLIMSFMVLFPEMSFFDKYQENEGKLRPFPSWYGSLDMGSLPHLYSPTNPITDEDIDKLLAIEAEDFEKWKRVKKSRELEIYSRKGTGRGSPPVYKVTNERMFIDDFLTIVLLEPTDFFVFKLYSLLTRSNVPVLVDVVVVPPVIVDVSSETI